MKIETIKVASLTPDPANVRQHNRRNLDSIKASLTRFGQVKPIVVDGKGVVIAGNGTLQAAIELGMTEVRALRTALTGAEAAAYAIADNRTAELAEWDEPELAKMLSALALEDEALLDAAGWSQEELDELILGPEEVEPERKPDPVRYASSIKAPIYVPRGTPPPLSDLADAAEVERLHRAIDAADVPADLRDFLRAAAWRHCRFHYARIADYYAHAPAEVQRLMEDSVLVVIDAESAIERGFMSLGVAIDGVDCRGDEA